MKEIGINPIVRSVLFAKLIDDIENEFIEHIKDVYGINVFDMPTEDEVVGRDWWLERTDCGGAEDWDFKILPKKPAEERKIKRVVTNEVGWDNLEEMN